MGIIDIMENNLHINEASHSRNAACAGVGGCTYEREYACTSGLLILWQTVFLATQKISQYSKQKPWQEIISLSPQIFLSMIILMLNQRVIFCEYIRLMTTYACLVPRLSAPPDYYKKDGFF